MDWGKYKAWFIGPKAENRDIFKELINTALDENMYWRKNFHPEDNLNISLRYRDSKVSHEQLNLIKEKQAILNDRIKNSTPFFSPRYMGHMATDPSLQGYLGYFTGMIFNNNNTTEEAAPATITLEFEAVKKMCDMACFPDTSWGHLTTGGSGANLQCLWRARDTRFFPYVFAASYLTANPKEAQFFESIVLPGRGTIGDVIENNQLRYLDTDEIYALLEHTNTLIQENPKISTLMQGKSLYDLGYMGFLDEMRKTLKDRFPPSFRWIVNKGVHYSVSKSLNFLGFGNQDIIPLELTRKWQIDLKQLDQLTDSLYEEGMAPLGLVAIFGSTELGATDNFCAIKDWILQRRKDKSGDVWLHADCAWGCYFLSIYHPEKFRNKFALYEALNDLIQYELKTSKISLPDNWSSYLEKWVEKYLEDVSGINQADSIVMDPHKTGYIPYPCGTSLFKNYQVRETAHYSFSPVNAKQRSEGTSGQIWDVPMIAYYTLEGSRASVGATGAWLVHETIPLTMEGMGSLMGRSVLSALLFQSLLSEKVFHPNPDCSIQFKFIDSLPMTGIVCYTFEIIYRGNMIPLKILNKILFELYEQQVLYSLGDFYNKEFILTMTKFDGEMYKNELDSFLEKTDIRSQMFRSKEQTIAKNPWRDDDHMVILRNVLFDPFFITYECKSTELPTREQRPIIEEYSDFIVNRLAELTESICNRRIEMTDRARLPGKLIIVDDNMELTSLLNFTLSEDFVDSSELIQICRSLDEAKPFMDDSEVNAVVTGLDLGKGYERGGVDVLMECAKHPHFKGGVLFTQANAGVVNPILKEVEAARPDWKLFYLQHFELASENFQFTLNRLAEMVWKIFYT